MSDPSYERINFALRPAKGAERKMIVEAIGRLRPFSTPGCVQVHRPRVSLFLRFRSRSPFPRDNKHVVYRTRKTRC